MNTTALITAFLGFGVGIAAAKARYATGSGPATGRRVQLLGGSLMPLACVLILVTSDPPSSSRTTHAVLFAIEMAMITIGFACMFAGLSITTKQRREASSINHEH
jgi:hypothetical protein